MSRKTVSRKIREEVYQKYNGHCAYCGCPISIKEMQVDHLESVYAHNGENEMDNYMPSCRQCNLYKSTFDLETFRKRLKEVMFENLRSTFQYCMALKYGFIEEKENQKIKFYFEKGDTYGNCN